MVILVTKEEKSWTEKYVKISHCNDISFFFIVTRDIVNQSNGQRKHIHSTKKLLIFKTVYKKYHNLLFLSILYETQIIQRCTTR